MRVWMVTAILLAVALAPVFDAPTELGEVSHDVQPSSSLQATVSPSTGWTEGQDHHHRQRVPRPGGQERDRRRADPPMGTDDGRLQR